MENKGIILICDNDDAHLQQLRSELENAGLYLEVLQDAAGLVSRAQRLNPGLIIVNPDVQAFKEYDVCKHLMKDLNVPVILLLDKNSTHRSQVDECRVEDVLTKPVEIRNLLNLIEKHLTISHKGGASV